MKRFMFVSLAAVVIVVVILALRYERVCVVKVALPINAAEVHDLDQWSEETRTKLSQLEGSVSAQAVERKTLHVGDEWWVDSPEWEQVHVFFPVTVTWGTDVSGDWAKRAFDAIDTSPWSSSFMSVQPPLF